MNMTVNDHFWRESGIVLLLVRRCEIFEIDDLFAYK